jgi:hypothetical protein
VRGPVRHRLDGQHRPANDLTVGQGSVGRPASPDRHRTACGDKCTGDPQPRVRRGRLLLKRQWQQIEVERLRYGSRFAAEQDAGSADASCSTKRWLPRYPRENAKPMPGMRGSGW